jgi:cell division protein ZapA
LAHVAHTKCESILPEVLLVYGRLRLENGGAPSRSEGFVAHRVKVEIYDQPYTIAGELDTEYVEKLANMVDAKMRDVARTTGTVDSVRVAVLAALAIADELEALREGREGQDGAVRQRAKRCLELVERALRQSN